jgi:hypothetical protein
LDEDASDTDVNFNHAVLMVGSDQRADSSLDICRCANGFCVCVVKGHVDSYFDDHSGGENGVQETLGVVISLIIVDVFVKFETVDGVIGILF